MVYDVFAARTTRESPARPSDCELPLGAAARFVAWRVSGPRNVAREHRPGHAFPWFGRWHPTATRGRLASAGGFLDELADPLDEVVQVPGLLDQRVDLS